MRPYLLPRFLRICPNCCSPMLTKELIESIRSEIKWLLDTRLNRHTQCQSVHTLTCDWARLWPNSQRGLFRNRVRRANQLALTGYYTGLTSSSPYWLLSILSIYIDGRYLYLGYRCRRPSVHLPCFRLVPIIELIVPLPPPTCHGASNPFKSSRAAFIHLKFRLHHLI